MFYQTRKHTILIKWKQHFHAVAFGVDVDYGTVANSKLANLLLLELNPLDSINAYDSIRQIIINGNIRDRSEFTAFNH